MKYLTNVGKAAVTGLAALLLSGPALADEKKEEYTLCVSPEGAKITYEETKCLIDRFGKGKMFDFLGIDGVHRSIGYEKNELTVTWREETNKSLMEHTVSGTLLDGKYSLSVRGIYVKTRGKVKALVIETTNPQKKEVSFVGKDGKGPKNLPLDPRHDSKVKSAYRTILTDTLDYLQRLDENERDAYGLNRTIEEIEAENKLMDKLLKEEQIDLDRKLDDLEKKHRDRDGFF